MYGYAAGYLTQPLCLQNQHKSQAYPPVYAIVEQIFQLFLQHILNILTPVNISRKIHKPMPLKIRWQDVLVYQIFIH